MTDLAGQTDGALPYQLTRFELPLEKVEQVRRGTSPWPTRSPTTSGRTGPMPRSRIPAKSARRSGW